MGFELVKVGGGRFFGRPEERVVVREGGEEHSEEEEDGCGFVSQVRERIGNGGAYVLRS